MKQKKSKKNRYEFGSFVKSNTSGIGSLASTGAGMMDVFKNPNKANIGLSTGQGMLSGAAAGASMGIPGMAVGAAIGGITGLIGASKQKRAIDTARDTTYGDLRTEQYDNMSTSNVNPFGTQMYQDGGRVAKNVRKPQPDISLPNWDGLVEKANGSIGMWGNPIDSLSVKPVLPALMPYGNIDHRGIQTGQKFQGTPATTKLINQREQQLKAQSSRNYYADGSDVEQNIINIEKGELQIDPNSGKVLREFNGINPETAGMYQSHKAKGKDTNDNFVTADPGTFIITKSKASKYKDAIDNNDKLSQQTILQNIRNYKSSVNKGKLKFELGSDVPLNPYLPNTYLGTSTVAPLAQAQTLGVAQKPFTPFASPTMGANSMLYKAPNTPYTAKSSMLSQGMEGISKYGPAAFNMMRGMFGKVEQESHGRRSVNPYMKQIQDNMVQDVDMQPIYNDIYSQQGVTNNAMRNNSNSSAVYRANRQNLGASTQRQLSGARMQGQLSNNQTRGQRGSMYASMGAQDMQDQQRLMMYNGQINQFNAQNRGAKQDMLGTGISQLQQVFQNDKYNDKLYQMQMMQNSLLPEMFSNWKHYADKYKLPNK